MEVNVYVVDFEDRLSSCTSEGSAYPLSKAGPIKLNPTSRSNKLPRLIKLERVKLFLGINDTCKIGCWPLNDLNIC